MTTEQEYDINAAEAIVAARNIDDTTARTVIKLITHLKNADEQLECIKREIRDGLPKLNDAFVRYGCKDRVCGTRACPTGRNCQAEYILEVITNLKRCLGV